LLFNVILILGGLIGYLSNPALKVCLDILSWIMGVIGVAVCANELIFLLRVNFLRKLLFKVKSQEVRVMECVSVVVGVGTVVGWWYSNHNMLINDIVCICIVVACIKILKFTNLKIASLGYLITMVI
jgi:hypothetical protein